MGLRFRKSVKIAPGVRLNLNKNSTSVSFGGKGAHYTVSSNGRRTASVGIPGTGISYSASTSSGKGGKARDTAKSSGGSSSGRGDNDKNGCLWLLLGIALLPILLTYWLWTTDMFKLSKKARAGIIAVMWAVLIILGIVGGNNREHPTAADAHRDNRRRDATAHSRADLHTATHRDPDARTYSHAGARRGQAHHGLHRQQRHKIPPPPELQRHGKSNRGDT